MDDERVEERGHMRKKLEEGRGGVIAKKFWQEMRDRWRKGKVIGRWEQKRKFYRERRVEEGKEERIG